MKTLSNYFLLLAVLLVGVLPDTGYSSDRADQRNPLLEARTAAKQGATSKYKNRGKKSELDVRILRNILDDASHNASTALDNKGLSQCLICTESPFGVGFGYYHG